MAKAKQIDPGTVVWFAPESVGQQALAERLAVASDPDEVREILNSRPTTGQYRELLGDELVDGPEGTTVKGPVYGDLVVWVDDAPDDDEDGAGHFERYSGDEADYKPKVKAEA